MPCSPSLQPASWPGLVVLGSASPYPADGAAQPSRAGPAEAAAADSGEAATVGEGAAAARQRLVQLGERDSVPRFQAGRDLSTDRILRADLDDRPGRLAVRLRRHEVPGSQAGHR